MERVYHNWLVLIVHSHAETQAPWGVVGWAQSHRAALAPIHLANDAGGLEMRAVNAADASTYGQTARKEASTAAQSGEMQGKAPHTASQQHPPLRGGRVASCSRFAEKEEQEAGTE